MIVPHGDNQPLNGGVCPSVMDGAGGAILTAE